MCVRYIQGETISYALEDASYASAVLHVGNSRHTLTKSGSIWSCSIDTSSMSGAYRFATIADGRVRDKGTITVTPLVSKYRAVVEAIDSALNEVSSNGQYSVTIGEISMQNKTFDEMVKAKNYYQRLADAEENGVTPSFGPRRVSEVYE